MVTSERSQSDGVRLYCMIGGMLSFDQNVFTHMQGVGTAVEVSTPIYLIHHPEGKVLFATGLHPAVAIHSDQRWGQRARDWKPRMTPDQAAVEQLATIGVRPKEIRYGPCGPLAPNWDRGPSGWRHSPKGQSGEGRHDWVTSYTRCKNEEA